MARLARALLVSVAVTRAQESDIFGLDYSPDHDSESGSDGSGMICDIEHMYDALKKANREADDVAVCHRDFLSETSSGPSDVDHCDELPPQVNCALSVYARAKPLTFIKKNYEAVLCCYQLGFAPDWIVHDFPTYNNDDAQDIQGDLAAAEGSRIDQLNENEDSDSSPRRELESANSKHPFGASLPQFAKPKTMAEWELLKAKLLERKTHPAFEALVKSHVGRGAPADGPVAPPSRKLGNSEDNDSENRFECSNMWDVRDEMLKVFDNAPVGAGFDRGIDRGGAHGDDPYYFHSNWDRVCVDGGCRTVAVYGSPAGIGDNDNLCFKGMIARFDISWVAARLAKTGILDCCIDMHDWYKHDDSSTGFSADHGPTGGFEDEFMAYLRSDLFNYY